MKIYFFKETNFISEQYSGKIYKHKSQIVNGFFSKKDNIKRSSK